MTNRNYSKTRINELRNLFKGSEVIELINEIERLQNHVWKDTLLSEATNEQLLNQIRERMS